MNLIDAAKQALEALEGLRDLFYQDTIEALRAAITEAERQEPEQHFRYKFLDRAALDAWIATNTHPQPAIPAGMVLVPVEPTEEEIDAPRYLFQALELGIKNIQDIRKHLERCGVDISCTPEWFRNDSGHLTKAGKAIVMRSLMLAAAPKPEEK